MKFRKADPSELYTLRSLINLYLNQNRILYAQLCNKKSSIPKIVYGEKSIRYFQPKALNRFLINRIKSKGFIKAQEDFFTYIESIKR